MPTEFGALNQAHDCSRTLTGSERARKQPVVSSNRNRTDLVLDPVVDNERLSDRGQVCYDWQHYITLLERKPGALRNGAPFADMPAPLQRLRQGLMRHAGGDRIMAQVLAAVPTAGLNAVLVAVELVLESGALSAEHVLNVLARLNASPIPDCVETTLQLKEVPLADTARYDSLRGVDDAGAVTANAVEADHA